MSRCISLCAIARRSHFIKGEAVNAEMNGKNITPNIINLILFSSQRSCRFWRNVPNNRNTSFSNSHFIQLVRSICYLPFV